MTFGRRQPRPERSSAMQAPPLQPAAVPDNLLHCANAAADIVAMLLTAYTFQERLQAESAIAAAAALTGEFALRSTGLPLPEKGTVSGNAANDVLFAGAPDGRATAWMFMMHAAMAAGVAEHELPRVEASAAALAQAPAGAMLPALSVQEKYIPHELPLNVGPRFRYRVLAIADTHDLSLREVTIALAAAAGQLIIRTQHEFPPRIAVTLATEIMLAVARMAPLAEVVTA